MRVSVWDNVTRNGATQIPGAALTVAADLADKPLQPVHALVYALALAAGIRIMDKDRLPNGLKITHQQMVNHAVAEISGKDLAQLREPGNKTDRRNDNLPGHFRLPGSPTGGESSEGITT